MRKIISLFLSLFILIFSMSTAPLLTSFAEEVYEVIAVTNTSGLNVRTGAGTSYDRVTTITRAGQIVEYNSKKEGSDGYYWYNITTPDGKTGYSREDYLDLYEVVKDADFEADLKEQGFTSEYIKYLRRVHAVYPNWKFNAVKTNLKWADVIEAESRHGQNAVEDYSYSDVWKSYEKGSYDFEKGKFVVIDSGGWVTTSKEAVEYCIDPRNYISNTTYIFAMESLSYSENHTKTDVNNIIKGSIIEGNYPKGYSDSSTYKTYADVIMKAAKNNKVSAYHIASRIKQEQGPNGNNLGRGDHEDYPGIFNHFNINAYAYGGRDAVTNGARYAATEGGSHGRPWNTPYKAINGGASFLAVNYFNDGQNTIYFEKFNVVTDNPFTHEYQTNVMAPMSESISQKDGYSDEMLQNSIIEFNIPIYSGLPKNVCPKPTAEGSNNNVIKSISINGYKLSPDFDKYGYEYKLVVDSSTSNINITATPYDSTATVTSTGKVDLGYGVNTIKIVCTAQTGNTRTYTLSVHRPNVEGDVPIEGEAEDLINSSYKIDSSYIRGIAENTTVIDFKKKFANIYDVQVLNDGNDINDGLVATGFTVKVYSGDTLKGTYKAVILGDINGDGKISTTDLLTGQRHILGKITLDKANILAGDVNQSDSFTTTDLLATQRHILGTSQITP